MAHWVPPPCQSSRAKYLIKRSGIKSPAKSKFQSKRRDYHKLLENVIQDSSFIDDVNDRWEYLCNGFKSLAMQCEAETNKRVLAESKLNELRSVFGDLEEFLTQQDGEIKKLKEQLTNVEVENYKLKQQMTPVPEGRNTSDFGTSPRFESLPISRLSQTENFQNPPLIQAKNTSDFGTSPRFESLPISRLSQTENIRNPPSNIAIQTESQKSTKSVQTIPIPKKDEKLEKINKNQAKIIAKLRQKLRKYHEKSLQEKSTDEIQKMVDLQKRLASKIEENENYKAYFAFILEAHGELFNGSQENCTAISDSS